MESDEKKGKKRILITVIAVIACIIVGIYYINSLKYEITDDAYIESDLIKVAAKVSGQIEEIYIKDNQKIKEGDLIIKIDDSDYKIKLDEAQAMYEKTLYSQKVAKAKLSAVNSEIELAKKDLTRYKTFIKQGQYHDRHLIMHKQNTIMQRQNYYQPKKIFYHLLMTKLPMQI